MNRDEMLARIEERGVWDVIVIGGGATGVGCAIDAASRGYRTVLFEQSDFAKGTSSRSTKLAHGGVRYLRQGNIALVLEALKERALMRQNAPHLVHDLSFIVPNYDWWEAPFYGIGLRLYDALAGRHGFGHSRNLSRTRTIQRIPTIETRGLLGGVIYYDGQFDDARMVVNMAQTAHEQGAALVNYMPVTGLIMKGDLIGGVRAHDLESGREFAVHGRVVINATGPFSDDLRRLDDPDAPAMIRPSQGVHIVLDKSFLPGESAIMVPHTDDGRVLFAIPWHGRVLIGTTDTPVERTALEPRPLAEEIEFLLVHAARYLTKDPAPSDVRSAFAGIRPLVGNGDGEGGAELLTSVLARDHTIVISRSGLLTIAGGKWTTYRRMAQDAVDKAATLAGLLEKPAVTAQLNIHGYHRHAETFGDLAIYGSDALALEALLREDPRYQERLHPALPIRAGEVIWAVRNEMVRRVEDFLSRRTRALLLDARASIAMAPAVAALMAAELGRSAAWQKSEVEDYTDLAQGYLVS